MCRDYASVAEWSIAFDCKSNALGLRRFESFPAHQNKNCFRAVFVLEAGSNSLGDCYVRIRRPVIVFCELAKQKTEQVY